MNPFPYSVIYHSVVLSGQRAPSTVYAIFMLDEKGGKCKQMDEVMHFTYMKVGMPPLGALNSFIVVRIWVAGPRPRHHPTFHCTTKMPIRKLRITICFYFRFSFCLISPNFNCLGNVLDKLKSGQVARFAEMF